MCLSRPAPARPPDTHLAAVPKLPQEGHRSSSGGRHRRHGSLTPVRCSRLFWFNGIVRLPNQELALRAGGEGEGPSPGPPGGLEQQPPPTPRTPCHRRLGPKGQPSPYFIMCI